MRDGAGKMEAEKKAGWPEDYHDYVFRDGKLVADFDNMYRHATGIPWDQDARCHQWYAEVGVLMLREQGPYEHILEVGCGLGYFTAKLKGLERGSIEGFDVSAEAIKKAGWAHPGIGFYVDDIAQASFKPRRLYDLVVVRDVFWYVFEHMATVTRNLALSLETSGFLYLCQSFPALDDPFVGKEVIPSPEDLLGYFPNYQPVYTALLRNHGLPKDGPILHFLGKKKHDSA